MPNIHHCTETGCSSKFTRLSRLQRHLNLHKNERPFKCQHSGCDRAYTNNAHLQRHIKSSHCGKIAVAMFQCESCEKSYSNRQNLIRHFSIAHARSYHKCKFCEEQFMKKNQLLAHEYSHTQIKSFSCDLCHEKFIDISSKKKHQRNHKQYVCECKESFVLWTQLMKHRREVHRPKEYICNHCMRAFKVRAQIIRHLKIHSSPEERICFKCPKRRCTKYYSTLFNLKHHIMSVHNDSTFDCLICDAKLSTKAKLKFHIKKKHTTGNDVVSKDKQQRKFNTNRVRADMGTFVTSTAMRLARIHVCARLEEDKIPEKTDSLLEATTIQFQSCSA